MNFETGVLIRVGLAIDILGALFIFLEFLGLPPDPGDQQQFNLVTMRVFPTTGTLLLMVGFSLQFMGTLMRV